jgi:methionyl-tRNA formyltransferase
MLDPGLFPAAFDPAFTAEAGRGRTLMTAKLRIVSFHAMIPAYQLVACWAKRNGHEIPLVVAPPPPLNERYGATFPEVIASFPPDQPVLITRKLRTVAAPVIAALEPDLVICAAFPLLIPPQVTGIPRYGALNLHPAPLPRGRGPNPIRLLYEGDLTLAGTVHRLVPEYDAGAVLSIKTKRIDTDIMSRDLFGIWQELLDAALDEAVARAVAGDPGDPQDETQATYAAPFSDAEREISWDEPFADIERKVAALNMMEPLARMSIGSEAVLVKRVRMLNDTPTGDAPGTLLRVDNESALVTVREGIVEVTLVAPFPVAAASR